MGKVTEIKKTTLVEAGPTLTLTQVRSLCREIADDIGLMASINSDPDVPTEKMQILKDRIRANLDTITDYWTAARKR